MPLVAAVCAALCPVGSAGPDPAGDGEIGLAELVALALKNDPGLIASRGEISIAEARKRTARDWPDPQLRLRKTWGFNEVPPAYTETRTETYNQRVNRREVDENGVVTRSTEKQRVQRTTERRVTPGRDRTVIDEKVRESSRESIDIAPNPAVFDPGGRATDSQNLSRQGTETRDLSFDPFASEEDIAVQLRFYVPHPAVRRARLALAQRQVELARNIALADEHEVVLEVREDYEELQFLRTRIALIEDEAEAAKRFSEAQDALLENRQITIDKLDFVDADGLAAQMARLEFEAKRDKLAARVGLRDPERIRVTDQLVSPSVNLDHTHLEYLIRLALANRGELSSIRGKGMIAEAELREFKAGLIPFPEYVQAEFGRGEQGGRQTDTSWGVQFAMSLPIFSLLGHEREIYEESIASHYSQMGASKEIVTAEVAAAYQGVRRSSAFRDKARAYTAAQAKRNRSLLDRLSGMEPHQFERTRYDITRSTARTDRRRLDAERAYNRSLLQLEEAIGTSLERIFTSGHDAPGEQVESAAATAPPQRPAAGEKPEPGRVPLLGDPPAGAPPENKTARAGRKGPLGLFRWGGEKRDRYSNRKRR